MYERIAELEADLFAIHLEKQKAEARIVELEAVIKRLEGRGDILEDKLGRADGRNIRLEAEVERLKGYLREWHSGSIPVHTGGGRESGGARAEETTSLVSAGTAAANPAARCECRCKHCRAGRHIKHVAEYHGSAPKIECCGYVDCDIPAARKEARP